MILTEAKIINYLLYHHTIVLNNPTFVEKTHVSRLMRLKLMQGLSVGGNTAEIKFDVEVEPAVGF